MKYGFFEKTKGKSALLGNLMRCTSGLHDLFLVLSFLSSPQSSIFPTDNTTTET